MRNEWVKATICALLSFVAIFLSDDVVNGQPSSNVTVSVVHKHKFTGTREEALGFMKYNREIVLSLAQEVVLREALDKKDSMKKPIVSAPCCADETAFTCCCECNNKRAVHGLSKKLIREGFSAIDVRTNVQAWLKIINPSSYAGSRDVSASACYVGGCGKPLNSDGCGGMEEKNLIFR